jgi:hypothetical protein
MLCGSLHDHCVLSGQTAIMTQEFMHLHLGFTNICHEIFLVVMTLQFCVKTKAHMHTWQVNTATDTEFPTDGGNMARH